MEKKFTKFVWIYLQTYDKQERIEKYWNRIFQLQFFEGELRCKVLPTIVKSVFILGQTNAEVGVQSVCEYQSSYQRKSIT